MISTRSINIYIVLEACKYKQMRKNPLVLGFGFLLRGRFGLGIWFFGGQLAHFLTKTDRFLEELFHARFLGAAALLCPLLLLLL